MKNLIVYHFGILVCLSLFSCKKNHSQPIAAPVDPSAEVLIAGNYTPAGKFESAAYWKDGTFVPLEDGTAAVSQATSIIKYNGKIYVGGNYNNKACIWEDGVRISIEDNYPAKIYGFAFYQESGSNYLVLYGEKGSLQKPATHAFVMKFDNKSIFFEDITSNTSSAYGFVSIPGSVRVAGKSDGHAVQWIIGGQKIDLGESYDIVAGFKAYVGSLHLCGDRKNSTTNLYESGYWKNITFFKLGNNSEMNLSDIDLDAQGNIYLVGYSKGADLENHATFWEKGAPFVLSNNSSRATAVTSFNGNRYIAGRELAEACYWLNKQLILLKTPNSVATAIYVSAKN